MTSGVSIRAGASAGESRVMLSWGVASYFLRRFDAYESIATRVSELRRPSTVSNTESRNG